MAETKKTSSNSSKQGVKVSNAKGGNRKVTITSSNGKSSSLYVPSAKKVVRAGKKAKKKGKLLPFIIICILFVLLGGAYFAITLDNPYFIKDLLFKPDDISDTVKYEVGTNSDDPINITLTETEGEFSMYFLEVGNEFTGDSVFIKAGDTDILIDAGSRNSSSTAISNFLNNGLVTDGKLEYVIATHAHQDHIAGFVGTSSDPGIFDLYECGTIIDFARTNSSTTLYKQYCDLRDKEVEQGAKHYTALECYNNENGAKRVYDLSNNVSMEILYNYYYENKTSNENNYSVCVMIHHGNRNFLLTGDLEAGGEKKLVQNNKLPEVELYKGGHHGSYTAGSYDLLNVIKPKVVCICCCAGSTEYTKNPERTFPAQDFISRICRFTDLVFATTVVTSDEKGYAALNGTITIESVNSGLAIACTNNNTLLKDSEWFKNNRKWE